MNAYERPQLTPEETQQLMHALNQIRRMGFQKTLIYLLNALQQNALLTKECNDHRAALGLPCLPTYKPEAK